MQNVAIASGELAVTISPLGAELQSLMLSNGENLLWNGDPSFWSGRSPLLFPIVGRVLNDRIKHKGRYYPLPSHGFARRRIFELVERSAASCCFLLRGDEETRKAYPFEFELSVGYEVREDTLHIEAEVSNMGGDVLLGSFGFHPAFRWPLRAGVARDRHSLRFERAETAPVRRAHDGLMLERGFPSPVEENVLHLRDELFDDGAIVWDQLASRSLTYGAEDGGPRLSIRFPDTPHLGVWTKPGARFLCVEPWQGFASLSGFDGELAEKPGIVSLPVGGTRRWRMDISASSAS